MSRVLRITRIAERRADLERERQAEEAQCIRLQKLFDTMKSMVDVFDAEDCAQVQAQIAARTARQEKEQLFRSPRRSNRALRDTGGLLPSPDSSPGGMSRRGR